MTWVVVGLGSNTEPERHLRAAVAMLAERFDLVKVSSVYQSPPADGSDQADYMNAAAMVRTTMLPAEVKRALREVEDALGRTRTADRFAARTIDLDMILYADWEFELAGKHMPDPDLLRHAYVAVPAAELLPNVRHSETGETLAAIARRLDRRELIVCATIALV